MIVQAAVARLPGRPLIIETLELEEPRDDELLVRLIASGVSAADLRAIDEGTPVPYPFVPGGEGAGIVERVGGEVSILAPGDAVILTAASCGTCPACTAGNPRKSFERDILNDGGRRSDGSTPFVGGGAAINGFVRGQSSFATHVLCHRSCAIKLPDAAALEVLACLGGGLQAMASIVLEGFSVGTEDTIVITGAGAEGLVATMVAAALGVKTIIVADPSEDRRARASALGATLAVHTDDDLSAVVRSLTGGARYALDTTGHEGAVTACRASLAPDGIFLQADLAIAGTPASVVARLAAWHAEGRFPLESLVTFFPFERIDDALAALATEAVVKPIVRFSIGSFGDLDRADSEGADVEPPEDVTGDEPEANDPKTVPALA